MGVVVLSSNYLVQFPINYFGLNEILTYGSTVDTFLFFSISFYATGVPWVTLSLGDLAVKILVAIIMLIPFRMLLKIIKPIKV